MGSIQRIHREAPFINYDQMINAKAVPTSWGKSPTCTRLAAKPATLPRITENRHLKGVDYVRTARRCIHVVTPGLTQNQRCALVSAAIGVSHGTVENILTSSSRSIKAEYLIPLMALVTATGRDVMAVEGVREVHEFIMGAPQ